jgi:hypothetical protein
VKLSSAFVVKKSSVAVRSIPQYFLTLNYPERRHGEVYCRAETAINSGTLKEAVSSIALEKDSNLAPADTYACKDCANCLRRD